MFYWWFYYFAVNNLSKGEKRLHSFRPPASVQVNIFIFPPTNHICISVTSFLRAADCCLVCRNHRKTHPPISFPWAVPIIIIIIIDTLLLSWTLRHVIVVFSSPALLFHILFTVRAACVIAESRESFSRVLFHYSLLLSNPFASRSIKLFSLEKKKNGGKYLIPGIEIRRRKK